MDSVQEFSRKSGLTAESLKASVSAFEGDDPVLVVGNKAYPFALKVCQEAYGEQFRSSVGIAIVGFGKYGWEIVDRFTLAPR